MMDALDYLGKIRQRLPLSLFMSGVVVNPRLSQSDDVHHQPQLLSSLSTSLAVTQSQNELLSPSFHPTVQLYLGLM